MELIGDVPFLESFNMKITRFGDGEESNIKQTSIKIRIKTRQPLRAQQNEFVDLQVVSFFAGFFLGAFFWLCVIYTGLAYTTTIKTGYVETVYPVFSIFALLSLHLFLYGCNLSEWRNTKINYNYIFGSSPTTALTYHDVLLICTSLMTIVMWTIIIHLLIRSQEFSSCYIDAIPGVLLLVSIGLLVCPFDVFYRSSRYYFIKTIRNIICSPYYKVCMVDFFMADQLTSQIPLLRHMESTTCYLVARTFKTHQYEACSFKKQYMGLAYIISLFPFYWRAMQCARRWFDKHDINHLANLGKYVSVVLAAFIRVRYAMQPTKSWLIMLIVSSSIGTGYQLYWDFVKDWGLLNPKSRNPWLRDKLMLEKKRIYYISIALNLVLRLVWIETVLKFNIMGMGVEHRLLDFFLASLEIIRRWLWNFYRLENEHLNNFEKPFHVKDSHVRLQLFKL